VKEINLPFYIEYFCEVLKEFLAALSEIIRRKITATADAYCLKG